MEFWFTPQKDKFGHRFRPEKLKPCSGCFYTWCTFFFLNLQWLQYVRWRPLACMSFLLILCLLLWKSSPSSCLCQRAQQRARAASADLGRLASKPSPSPLLKSQRWRKKAPLPWKKKGPVAPFCNPWKTCGEAHRPSTAHQLPIAAQPQHKPAWTPATLIQPSKAFSFPISSLTYSLLSPWTGANWSEPSWSTLQTAWAWTAAPMQQSDLCILTSQPSARRCTSCIPVETEGCSSCH